LREHSGEWKRQRSVVWCCQPDRCFIDSCLVWQHRAGRRTPPLLAQRPPLKGRTTALALPFKGGWLRSRLGGFTRQRLCSLLVKLHNHWTLPSHTAVNNSGVVEGLLYGFGGQDAKGRPHARMRRSIEDAVGCPACHAVVMVGVGAARPGQFERSGSP
jgi:hypothetical protein